MSFVRFLFYNKNKRISRKVSKSSKGETFGFVSAGRGGALGAAGVGFVGKFWNILCCSNWAFCKVSSSNSYLCNKFSVCCWILWGLELPWNGRITALMRAHEGQKSIGIFFPRLAARSTFSLTWCQISKSKLPSSGNQGLYLTTVWRQASIHWCETESPWTLYKWSKVDKRWGFPAICTISPHLPTSVGPNSHSTYLPRAFTRSLFGRRLSLSL